MKRILSVLFIFALIFSLGSGCASGRPDVPTTTPDARGNETSTGENLSIVSTIFPQYDWVKNILGEKAGNMDLTLLISSTVDLHSYNPSVSDIAKVSTADLFIYVGGDSDAWVEDVLKQTVNPNMVVINLLDVLGDGAKFEEIIEGMQHDHDDCDDEDHDHDHDDCDDEDHDHHHDDIDEHVWLSLKNAVIFCHAIAEVISSLDPENADIYTANLNIYIEKLLALDEEYTTALSNVSNRTLLFADRFPFRYLVDDYGLNYYAAFSGCSAETEASFSTIIFLAQKVDELRLNTVMITESGNRAIAETVINTTQAKNQQILELDAMQAITISDVQNGATFLSIMESNLLVLKEALK